MLLDVRALTAAVLLVGCASAAAAPPSSDAPVPPPRPDGRLPAGVRPTHYALELVVDPARKVFSGRVRIDVTIEKPTRAIVLHGRGLTVRQAVLQAAGGTLPARAFARLAAGSRVDPEELALVFAQEVPAGEAQIQIDYQAPFADGLRGLYRVSEDKLAYAFTQFEPNDARRAFPCFDEPGFKTPFDVMVTVPRGSLAVANAPEAARHVLPGGDEVRFEFARTPPLPTYLVAVAVGPFDVLVGPESPVRARLIATKGKAAAGKLALDTAVAHVNLLGKYFDRPYPYPKLDIVAVPSFGAGAMENPGLLTFREELLLMDPARASTAALRAMARVVAHELSHQWFGDLVTMQWWDDLWLNEAFASFLADKIVDEWRPETGARLQALASKSEVMSEDALVSARRIRNPVRSTSEALEAFDGITYAKGRAVLAMVEAWLGEDHFRDGLRRYLAQHAWGNATAADLYAALRQASGGRDVAGVMNSFTDQPGVPIVTAKLACYLDQTPPEIIMRQREYRTLERQGPSETTWHIPVCVSYDAGAKLVRQCTLLDGVDGKIDLVAANGYAAGCPAFFYPNAGDLGYYRVHLDPSDVTRLRDAAALKLPEAERFGLLSNVWAGVWSGELPASAFLDLAGTFKDDDRSRLVWDQIADALETIDRALITNAAHPAFARFVRDLFGPAARRLGWTGKPGESDDRKLLREVVLGTLGHLGEDDRTLAEARRITQSWLANPQATSGDLARIAVPLAAARGDDALFDRLLGVLKRPQTPELRLLALAGLTAFDDPRLVERTLGLTLDGTIKSQDLRYVFPQIGARRTTRQVVYAWIERSFDDLIRVLPQAQIGRVARVTGALCDEAKVHAAETFWRARIGPLEGADKDVRQSVEAGVRCAALAAKERAPTSAWLSGPGAH
jgi:cytosol alanyl aminopeptidase